ncbi:MAG TPA: FAD-dependent oxidoreductase, partial [Gammaproteobacteria bacterium]|nr:FAD-dependent oxidoreductase [Gammaproteobacteria bacterium]
PYDYKQLIRFIRHLRVAFRRRSLGPFITDIFRDENFRLRMFPFTKTFLFPQGGSRELTAKLASHARKNNVAFLKQTRVASIRFDQKRQHVVIGAGGKYFKAKEVVAGSQAQLADALHLAPGPKGTYRRVFTHVNLVFRDRSAPTFSYVRFLRHHAAIRMTDISNHIRHHDNNLSAYRVICIGVRESYDRSMDDAEKVEQLTELLKKYRFINPSATCVRSYWSRYPAEFLSDESRQKLLHEFSPMLRFVSTTNFSTGIVRNLGRWEQAFASNSIPSEVSRTMVE